MRNFEVHIIYTAEDANRVRQFGGLSTADSGDVCEHCGAELKPSKQPYGIVLSDKDHEFFLCSSCYEPITK